MTDCSSHSTKEKILVFDLDGTLYPAGEYVHHARSNIFKFMCDKGMASSIEEAESIWRPLFQKYNQSYKGLISGGFSFDRDEYWRAHRDGARRFMSADLGLAETLSKLPQKKVIFTNCREAEALELLDILGVRTFFDAVYGADFLGNACKPEKESFEKVFEDLKILGDDAYFFEDSIKNLKMGSDLGMTTVLIDGMTASEEGGVAAALHDQSNCNSSGSREAFISATVSTLSDGGLELHAALPSLFL